MLLSAVCQTTDIKISKMADSSHFGLEAKNSSNHQNDIRYEFLEPKYPRNHILYGNVDLTNEKLVSWNRQWRPFWILGSLWVCPHFREGRGGQIFYVTFIEYKSTEKATFALHGHGIGVDDPTMILSVLIRVK